MKKNNITYHLDCDITLRRNPYSGLYIAFEGIDGSGKTTQVDRVREVLEREGKEVVVTSEPRKEGSPVGELIHKVLTGEIKIPSESLQYLYTADRIINHRDIIEPALKASKVVLAHRSLWSNLPYGMLDHGIVNYSSNDARVIDTAHGLLSLYHQFIVPDITIYLRINVETAVERLLKMDKVKEMYEKKEKLTKILDGYEWEVKTFKEEFTIINGERNPDEITKKILMTISI